MTEQQVAKGLMEAGRLTAQQVETAVKNRKPGVAFAQTVVDLGFLTAEDITTLHPNAFEVPVFHAGNGTYNGNGASNGNCNSHAGNGSTHGFSFRSEDLAEISGAANASGGVSASCSNGHAGTAQRNGTNGSHAAKTSNGIPPLPVKTSTSTKTSNPTIQTAARPAASALSSSAPAARPTAQLPGFVSGTRPVVAHSNGHSAKGASSNGTSVNGNHFDAVQMNGTSVKGTHAKVAGHNGAYLKGAQQNGKSHAAEVQPDQSNSVPAISESIAPSAIMPAPRKASAAEVGLGQDDAVFLDSAEVLYDGEEPGSIDESRGPTVQWCNELLKIAVQTRSSDMHLEPRPDGLLPRYRIDGHLRPGNLLPREYMPAIISRFKVLGNLDIAENRMPQDGRFRASVGGRLFDFRVSTLPGMHGEKVVLRLLDRTSLVTDLTRLGFTGQDADAFQKMLERSHGMILVTGPTGSGKTTTLYAALSAANDESKNVITVEDPVEYELEGVTQCKVQPGIGLTFAAQLRAILRQDPDVILVGEIRDGDTAEIAIRAALTGHLVLSTLHTNSAVGAVTRMQDMGVAPFLIASSLSGVIAQRLVRMICRHCKALLPTDHPSYAESIERLKLDPGTVLHYGTGCQHCSGTGMRGRLALIELLQVDSSIRKAIMAKEDAGELRSLAINNGMKTLWQDGMEKLHAGLTTGAELIRVLMGHDEEE